MTSKTAPRLADGSHPLTSSALSRLFAKSTRCVICPLDSARLGSARLHSNPLHDDENDDSLCQSRSRYLSTRELTQVQCPTHLALQVSAWSGRAESATLADGGELLGGPNLHSRYQLDPAACENYRTQARNVARGHARARSSCTQSGDASGQLRHLARRLSGRSAFSRNVKKEKINKLFLAHTKQSNCLREGRRRDNKFLCRAAGQSDFFCLVTQTG